MRKPARDPLREDFLIIQEDLEDSTRALDQLGLNPESTLNLVRQTGGAGVVVSDYAVLDRDLRHGVNLPAAL